MIFSSPLWLCALALIPLIWWLHRFRRRGQEFMVSSLIPWLKQMSREQSGGDIARADRIWLLRAFIVSLLALALAGPGWKQKVKANIHLWLDDSISMGAMEGEGKTRMELGLSQLLKALDENHARQVQIHSLADPPRPALELPETGRARWKTMLEEWVRIGEQSPSPPKFIPQEEEHWVLTDGADERLNQWIAKAPLQRVLTVGTGSENSAISLLALRPAVDRPATWLGLVQVDNLGHQTTRRTLEVFAGGKSIGKWQIEAPQGASRQIEFDLPTDSTVEVKASLSAEDALVLDDSLAVTVPGKTVVRILGDCEPPIVAAIKAHPRITQAGEPQLGIVCKDAEAPKNLEILRLHGGQRSWKLKEPAVWLAPSGKLSDLDLAGLNAFEADGQDGSPLLISDSKPLITLAESPKRRVDCYLDLADEEFARKAEFPVLIAGLVNIVLAGDILDGVATSSRPTESSKISPGRLPASSLQPGLSTTCLYDLTPALVALLLPALLLDTWLSRRKQVV